MPLQSADTPVLKKQGTFSGGVDTIYPSWFKESFLDFQEDIEDAAEQGKRVMILFHKDQCPYCNALVERNLAQKEIKELMQEKFEVIAINMWGDREVVSIGGQRHTEKSFARALNVQFTPTIIVFNEQGKIALRKNGYVPPTSFKLLLQYLVEKQEVQISFRDYLKKHRPIAASGQLNHEDFYQKPPHDLSKYRQAKQPFAVFFEQKQCPNCDALHQKVLLDPATRSVIGQFKTIQLDMWSDEKMITPEGQQTTARAWAKQLKISYAPSIVVFNREGKEGIRSEAFFKRFHTQSIFHYILEDAHKTEPSFQRYLSARAEHLNKQGVDVDIWDRD